MDLAFLLRGVLPPVLIALALVSVGGSRLLSLATAIGFVAVFVLQKEWPRLPHELWANPDARHWLVWCVVAIALVGLLERLRVLHVRVAQVVGVAVIGFAAWLLLQKIAARQDAFWFALHVVGGGLVAAALALAGRRFVGRAESSPFVPGFFVVVLAVDAVVMEGGATALFAQLCGACAAAIGAGIGTALWLRPLTIAPADGMWIGGVHGLFLLAGHELADVSLPATLCAAAAPVLPLAVPGGMAKERPKRWMAVTLLLAAAPAGVAIWLTHR